MKNQLVNKPLVIALCGKGGVGKTTIAAAIVRELVRTTESKVLAIDADPAVGLATALSVDVKKTVDDIRNDVIDLVKKGKAGEKKRVLGLIDYEMLGALSEHGNFAFLAIGRPETEGCYCQVNDLLKDIIAGIADNFDYVIIDAEAGVEQVNRRVLETVTHLVLVSDLSAKGLNVARTIHEVARDAVKFNRAGLIINKMRDSDREHLSLPEEIPLLGSISECDEIRDADMRAESFLQLPDNACFKAVRDCLAALGVVAKQNMHEVMA